MVVGGLLLLSATRSYALYRATRRHRIAGPGWTRLIVAMLLTGAALLGLGYSLASS